MKEDTSNMIQRNAPRRYSNCRDGMQRYASGIRDFLKSAVGHLVIWSFGHLGFVTVSKEVILKSGYVMLCLRIPNH